MVGVKDVDAGSYSGPTGLLSDRVTITFFPTAYQ